MKCKTCGKEFHYCDSCSPEPDCDYGFCSRKCLEDSENFKVYKNIFNALTKDWPARTFEILCYLKNTNEYFMDILMSEGTHKDEIQK